METLLYYLARTIVAGARCLPLRALAWVGRRLGGLAWILDKRHRTVARENIAAAFPEKSKHDVTQLARDHFQRLGETYACILQTGGMNAEQIRAIVTFEGYERLESVLQEDPEARIILAIGHYGNFELFSWIYLGAPTAQPATTYRALRQPRLTELMLQLRKASGCLYFERRTEGEQLKAAMKTPHIVLGLLADQNAGDHGLWLPVFGRDTSVSPAPAVFAQRYKCRLFPSACFRTEPGRWHIELGEEIPTRTEGKRRSTQAITQDIIAAQEETIRRDPANWFWVHNRWKPRPNAHE